MSRATLVAGRLLRIPDAVHRPAPSLLTFTGLTSKPFWERTDSWVSKWIDGLEAATPEIAAEYDALRGTPSDYKAEASDHGGTLHTGATDWHWSSLVDRGNPRPDMMARCPRTSAVLQALPGLCVDGMPFGFAFFSTLAGGCRIAPHTSPANLRVRVHLPLRVPEPELCGITVAGETRRWEVGRALVFDDAFVHSVYNDGAADRVVLLFDLWHPELRPDERAAIQAMFREVEAMRQTRHEKEAPVPDP